VPHRSGVPGTSPLRYANGDAHVVATKDSFYQFVRAWDVQVMCHLQSSSAGTTTWTEQAIHPEARKVSSGPPFRQCLAQKYRYAGTLGVEG
jgi:hypothetical protein